MSVFVSPLFDPDNRHLRNNSDHDYGVQSFVAIQRNRKNPKKSLFSSCHHELYLRPTFSSNCNSQVDYLSPSLPGRLLICGGYGMFELWDHNVTMRCNEVRRAQVMC